MSEFSISWLKRLSELDFETLTEDERLVIAQAIAQYEMADPVVFAERRLGIRPWSRQSEILRAVAQYPRVAVRSGHKIGKSNSAAILALWWVCLYPDGKVIITAPTDRQVQGVIWKEIRRLYRTASPPIGGQLHRVADPGLQFDDGVREIRGFSTNEPEKIAGFSGNILYIVDEGSGVDEQIYEVIEGSRAGGAKLVVFGNPTQTSGTFFEAFTSAKDAWHTIHVSSEDSPNITGECEIPGLAVREWMEEKLREWGEDSPLYQVRVRGNFPLQAENAVIGIGLVEEASKRWAEMPEDGPLTIGVDVARFGDDETVIQPVRGKKALKPITLNSMDTVQVAGRVAQVVREMRRDGEFPQVKVDVIGVGAGVADYLRALEGLEAVIVDVNVGEASTVSAPDEPEYARLRDQVWFMLKAWLKNGGAIPDDGKLHAELLAPLYGFTVDGKLKVEPKEETKKRIKRSPDRADALCLAAYPGRLTAWQQFSD
jgi:phage terminase large subunit